MSFLFKIIVFIICTPMLFVRFLRWLAIIQQKEYRIDRIFAFLNSGEGKKDLLKLFPDKQCLTRIGLKRPVITFRISFVALISFCMSLFPLLAMSKEYEVIIYTLILLLVIPLLVFISSLPTSIVHFLVSRNLLFLARVKIEKHKPLIIGITGSYGKTITKHLIGKILSKKEPVFVTPLSYNTPFSISASILKSYRDQKIVIIEYGAYKKGEIKRLTDYFPPQIAIVTGITDQHFALFGNRNNLIAAKSELVESIPKGGIVFCGSSDKHTRKVCKSRRKGEITFIKDVKKEFDIKNIRLDNKLNLVFDWGIDSINSNFIGKHNINTLCIGIAVGSLFDVSVADIKRVLSKFNPDKTSISLNKSKRGIVVVDDGKSTNPVGFKAAINVVQELKQKNKFTNSVLITQGIVDLGEKSERIHKELALLAKSNFSKVFYLGLDGKASFTKEFKNFVISDITLIREELGCMGKGDLVLLEGRLPNWIYQDLGI